MHSARGRTTRRQLDNSVPAQRRVLPATHRASSFNGAENAKPVRPKCSGRASVFGDDITNTVAGRGPHAFLTKPQKLGSSSKPAGAPAEKRGKLMQSGGYPIFPPPSQVTCINPTPCAPQQPVAVDFTAPSPAAVNQSATLSRSDTQPLCPRSVLCKEPGQEQREGEPRFHVDFTASASAPRLDAMTASAVTSDSAKDVQAWCRMLDPQVRYDMHLFFAEAAAHYGKWCEEAALDAMAKWGLSRKQVDDLAYFFSISAISIEKLANASTFPDASTGKHAGHNQLPSEFLAIPGLCSKPSGTYGMCTCCSNLHSPRGAAEAEGCCKFCGKPLTIIDPGLPGDASSSTHVSCLSHAHTAVHGETAAYDADMSVSTVVPSLADIQVVHTEHRRSQGESTMDFSSDGMDDLMEALLLIRDALSCVQAAEKTREPSDVIKQHLSFDLKRLSRCPKVAAIVSKLPSSCQDASGQLVHLELEDLKGLYDEFQRAVDPETGTALPEDMSHMDLDIPTQPAQAHTTQTSIAERAITNYSCFKGCLPEQVSLQEVCHTTRGVAGWAAMHASDIEELRIAAVDTDCENLRSVLGSIAEYAPDVFSQLFRTECVSRARLDYMDGQPDINGKMRAILIDWLVEVHLKYKLRSETLFLCVNIIDRFLSSRSVTRRRLQLVGVCALFVAAKLEEIHAPEVRDFVYVCDNAYSTDDILNAEVSILTGLNFRICSPTAVHFLEPLCRINRCCEVHRNLAQYIAELALLDLPMIRYSPSQIASASLLLSNQLLGREPVWPASTARHARHTQQALTNLSQELRTLLHNAPSMQLGAVRMKFSYASHKEVAKMVF